MRAIAYCASALALMALAAPAAADTVPFVALGSKTFAAPETGVYDILAIGAQGGDSNGFGGLGAEVGGDFRLTAGEVLSIVVGLDGNGPQGFPSFTGDGGGGTLVLTSTGTALLIAGGGGGASDEWDGGPGLISGNGGNAYGGPGGNGGVDGSGGGAGVAPDAAGGGGGLNSAGGGGLGGFSGDGVSGAGGAQGGGGGGGGGNLFGSFGGGGGGFSGGGGGGDGGIVDGVDAGGGGGGSLNTAFANLIGFDGVQSGNGEVEIDFVGPAIPEPSTWAMLLLGFAGLGALAYRRNEAAPASESIGRALSPREHCLGKHLHGGDVGRAFEPADNVDQLVRWARGATPRAQGNARSVVAELHPSRL